MSTFSSEPGRIRPDEPFQSPAKNLRGEYAPARCAAFIAAFTLLTATAFAQPADFPIRFTDAAESSGLLKATAGIMGHGGAIGDYDGDGRLDLLIGGFCDRPDAEYAPAKGPVPVRLLRQRPDRTFEIVSDPAVSFFARTSGAVFADLDNEGTLELYIANNARPRASRPSDPQKSAQTQRSVLLQYKDGTWHDISEVSGACPPALLSARNIGVFDYDNDGLNDLLIIEDRFVSKGVTPRTTLLRNLGGLKFEDVNAKAGLPDGVFGLGHAVADLNDDGRPDFFIAHSNRLFLSTRDGKYRESPLLTKTFEWQPLDGEDWPCGAAFADLNRDGRLDLVVSIHSVKARNRVYINAGLKDGVPLFSDVTKEAGLGDVVPVRCPHVEIQDFDNDGWPDIYMSAGWRHEDGRVEPLVYRGLGSRDGIPRFAAGRPMGDGKDMKMVYYPAGPTADIDGDGRLEILLINWFAGDHCHLLRNDCIAKRWLDVRVVGRKKVNRMGIGSRVTLYKAGNMGNINAILGCREIHIGTGYASGQPAIAHFGLGDAETVDVEIKLPDGRFIERSAIRADQVLTVEEP